MPARTDQVTDPGLAAGLLLARRGQAYFSRLLNDLSDSDVDADSLLPGWSRRKVVAHVGLNARALTRLTEWARTGLETPMYSSATQRDTDIELAATLPVQALRNLSDHAAIHLSVEWRDLPPDAWLHEVRTAQGRLVPVSETVWMRTREVWLHAVDLRNGGAVGDFPAELHDLLLDDLVRTWGRKVSADAANLELRPRDRTRRWRIHRERPEDAVVVGTAAELVAWGTGRDRVAATTAGGAAPPAAPRWL